MPDIVKSPECHAPFLELLSSAEEIQVDEVIVPPKKTSDGFHTYYVKVKPKDKSPQPSAPQTNVDQFSLDYLVKNARLLLDNDEFLLARNLFSLILQRDIRHHEALFGFGKCLRALGQVTSAKKCFLAVVEIYNDARAQLEMALCCTDQGEDETALDFFENVQDETLESSQKFILFKEWGNCLTRTQDLNGAQKKYQKALELNPNSDVLFINLGTLAIQTKAYEEAERYFEKARSINPRSAKASCGLGLVSMERDSISAAQKFFLEALKQDPLNKVALLEMSAIAQRTSDFEITKILLEDAVRELPDETDLRYPLAAIYYSQEQWRECEMHIDSVLDRDPTHERASKLKSALLSQQKGVAEL